MKIKEESFSQTSKVPMLMDNLRLKKVMVKDSLINQIKKVIIQRLSPQLKEMIPAQKPQQTQMMTELLKSKRM
jgi:hypothetical protein